MGSYFLININKMSKTLRVIEPFFTVDTGDTFEWNDSDKMYVSQRIEEFHKTDDSNSELRSMFNSNFAISADYAKELIADGYLEEATEKKVFTNVFDEIQRLHNKYTEELKNVDEDMAHLPQCVKVERVTVLNNILSVLDHLNSLKK